MYQNVSERWAVRRDVADCRKPTSYRTAEKKSQVTRLTPTKLSPYSPIPNQTPNHQQPKHHKLIKLKHSEEKTFHDACYSAHAKILYIGFVQRNE